MLLYADEDFALPVVTHLRSMGHDVVTVQEDGLTSAEDGDVLARANALGRVVLTFNRRHFERLHLQGASHCGIVSATRDQDFVGQAQRIDAVLAPMTSGRWCVRVNKPPKP